ncbi:unnamed protein product [Chrysoparadoxa australica]
MGDLPTKRSGHSFTVVGSVGYLLGGCPQKRPPGPTDEMYKLDMSNPGEFYWQKVPLQGKGPKARWHHSAAVHNNTVIVVFGGFQSSSVRYNDIWMLDTQGDKWSQPPAGVTEETDDGSLVFKKPWKGCPDPRGAHSGSILGHSLVVFGGYGGPGFSRRDYNDLHVLNLDTWNWSEIDASGEIPEPRSGHQTVVVKENLLMCGGWNSVQQLDDLFVLDSQTWTWTKAESGSGPEWGPPRWNHAAVAIKAMPHWKVFVFGGNSGNLADSGSPQGEYLNDLCVLDTGTNTWSKPIVTGEVPAPRADTQVIFDAENSRLLLFGGWADKWFGELCVCSVGEVVGPPYSLESMTPTTGPLTGGTNTIITGLGFQSVPGSPSIRFACTKGYLEVTGEVVSDTQIRFDTPNFEKFGPVATEIRVSIGPKGLTSKTLEFQYFSVGDATKTLAFGPGLLDGFAAALPVQFMIQAIDKIGNERVCGMDEFDIVVTDVAAAFEREQGKAKAGAGGGNDEDEGPSVTVPCTIEDHSNGTYTVTYTAPRPGEYTVTVDFLGTFNGIGGPVRGSPFTVCAVDNEGSDKEVNSMKGPLMMNYIKDSTKELKDFCNKSLKGLRANIPKESRPDLIRVKEFLKGVNRRQDQLNLRVDSNLAAIKILRKTEKGADRMMDALDSASTLWSDAKSQVPITAAAIVPLTQAWATTTEESIGAYEKEVETKATNFKNESFWVATGTPESAREALSNAEAELARERLALEKNAHLANIFDFPEAIKASSKMIEDMESQAKHMYVLWDVFEGLQSFISDSKEVLWSEVDPEGLEDDAKGQVKKVKALHKETRWCEAYKAVDKTAKDFVNTIPLISLLGHKSMRPRHWEMLQKATGKTFKPPYEDPDLKLGQLLALNLHEFSGDVEEICDQAVKEEKMEVTLGQLEERWSSIEWLMDLFSGTDVPLLKIAEEDFEALEADQLIVQGMMASRYKAQFEDTVNEWQRSLAMVSDVFTLVQEIQRTWSYLEPLFIKSEEVKRELPEDAKRFEGIDADVKNVLKKFWSTKNVRAACNLPGYNEKLESVQDQLELCKKSLSDFLDGRRRQFPRYYFVSEADLLDILSNGSDPNKVLVHTPKVYLCTKTLVLSEEKTDSGRPYANKLISGVGSEEMEFQPPIPLNGKVEIYMQDVLDGMKKSLFCNLEKSLVRYHEMSRPEWLMHKNPATGQGSDPAQIILLTLAINYVQEVEQTFGKMEKGDPKALETYNKKQMDQLSDLIHLTQSDLSKGDRTRVMVCITMDAHGRDVVQKMMLEGVTEAGAFQWQSQLKHKWRKSPPNASFINRDPHLRGKKGERAEIAIADAIMPYDYEYLGNGPRLVITPLTDRIYVTATQALNLKMGCAPAGPAGTGKTESTKDLANALAKCCYVFNCSPEMDYQGLGNIFKGLASSGAWGCFDEFNRLIPEVLSVCSVQFKAVCDGVKAEAARIVIEGDEVSLDPTCGAYITMNPGYLGRSELPEGLKALFRPMTVMVPDLVLICENMLMSEGFITAKVLASKFYGLYSLLRELLSKQMHYDWGLRAVKSVLVVAGAFKRAEPELAEDALLMRALRDFNIPKIVREDEVVFFGLLGDLFPGIDPPRKVDKELEGYVVEACSVVGNHNDDLFCLKVVQLEELLAIRHCVFVMGPPGAGKSQCWKTLAAARKIRDPTNQASKYLAPATKIMDVNPKSIKTEELYGYISMATREWKDGLLSKVMRDLGNIPDEKPKWILLDGDLDANWIESMNSVMDDNRMLTLASNERIPLKPHMRLIFEIRDLKYATPATVSRAGILYISTDDGTQWRSLIESWLVARGERQEMKDYLREFFDTYMAPTLLWIKLNVKPIVPVEDMNLVMLYMMDGLLTPANTASKEALERVFVFCAIWAFGSTLTVSDDGTDYQKMFSDWWRGEWQAVKFPSRETVFDYWLDPESDSFGQWTKSPYFFSIDYDSKTTPMGQVTVPTPETCSVTFWMQLLVKMRKPVMMAGPSGTGKTQMVIGMLQMQDPEEIAYQNVNFNFYTTSAVLQNTMGLPLEKKTGTNFGPPGNKKMVYFLDDINLPEVDPYNTQSAIALLRQHMEYDHVYDLGKLTLKNISNTQVVACMNPTAGCFLVNPRLQRWFATFAIGLPGPTSLLTIYQTFLDGHLQHFEAEIAGMGSNLIKAALGLHTQVAQTFRKTATNFHYEFNIRHLSNVFQGLLVSQPDQFQSSEKFVQLWLHESERVYGDRLVSTEDLQKYNQLAQQQCKKLFPSISTSKFYAAENADPLVFCHFAENIQDQVYEQIQTLDQMSGILEDALREYNETFATMDLVLFEDAMKHIARIVRIVLNEGGHALLVGVGGSGKQSLSRLSAYICSYTVSQIVISSTYSINDLKEDLKTMYNKAGNKDEGVMFLLTDSQITNERFLIYINDLLASGNIPDLFAQDEVDTIVNNMANKVKAEGLVPDSKNCWDYFIKLIRKNLHVVLAFSPVGDDFRNRARKFPAIVNCTVIDWFQPWPKASKHRSIDALFSVGKKFLADMELGSDGMRQAVEKFLPFSFEAVNKAVEKFKQTERRFVYTTPKSFLELLKLYNVLLASKRESQEAAIERLANGLTKLRETKASVNALEEEIKVMLEDAEQKKVVADGIAETVSKEKAIVEVETANAQVESKQVAGIQAEVSVKQRDTEADLAKAEPAVEAAMAALDTLNKKDLGECKTMAKPPAGVDDVFAATMILLAGVSPSVVITKAGKVKDRTWDAAKKQLLGDIGGYIDLLKGLKAGVDDDTIPNINWKEIRPLLALEHFNVEVIQGKNSAAAGVCGFVLNIVTYHDIVVTVEPKRKALAEANEQLNAANTRLKEVQDMVAELEAKLAVLTADLNAANAEKQAAMDSVAKGQIKLDLAQRLTGALSSENDRWAENVVQLEADMTLLTGDVLLASAFISYVGPFTKPFRDQLMINDFLPFLRKEFGAAVGEGGALPMSDDPDPIRILTTSAEIAGWNTDGLPSDQVSTENGAIVSNSARWPLMIDPQLQGIRWIKNKEGAADRNLQVVRLGQKELLSKLEKALEGGHSVLIENLGETLEAVLNPVIQRAVIYKGRKMYIKLGDSEVEFHPDFRLFLQTKLSNPHYPPEIQAETTLINFTVTALGLEDQLLNLVVKKERPDLADLGEKLVTQQNGFKIKMKELEDNILFKLASAEGDITEDVELIEGLEETKRIATDISQKAELALKTQESIYVTSEKYRPVANRSSLLFFLMNDLVKVHSYYIYSLAAFTKVFYQGIDKVSLAETESSDSPKDTASAAEPEAAEGEAAEGGDAGEGEADAAGEGNGEEDEEEGEEEKMEMTDEELAQRCLVLIDSITATVFNYIRRGLFERDKLTVSTMLTLQIAVCDGKLNQEEVDFLVMSKASLDPGNMGPLGEWMPEAIWPKIKALEGLKRFHSLGDAMQSDSDDWQAWFDNEQAESAKLPGDFEKSLSKFDRLILLRAVRPDRLSTCFLPAPDWIADTMGKQYVLQPGYDMKATYAETSSSTPMFFVLFPGVDPTPWVEGLGKTLGISTENNNFINISMGQGQEKPAEGIVEKFAKDGGWVMLQNCHLMQSWVPRLERLLEIVQEDAHESFRCFISAEPPPMASMKNMPESLMQSCIKVANEAPADIKSNLIRALENFSQERVDECTKPTEFKSCLFSLCWFHSIVLGRRRFGQQGWSRPYSFNTGDLNICSNVLTSYLNDNDQVPWDDLRYIFGEIMYGGHITDAWDRRTNNTYLSVLLNEGLFTGMDLGPKFKAPSPTEHDFQGLLDYVDKELPPESPPQFGLHPNAEIGYLTQRCETLFQTILNIGGGSGGGGGGNDSVVKDTMLDLLERLPEDFAMLPLQLKAKPLMEGESGPFVVVALQECTRMNALLSEIRRSLVELDKGLKGQLNMSQSMEDLAQAFRINQWPGRNPFSLTFWEKLAWPSQKSLTFQFLDMLRRIDQLNEWVEELIAPMSLWLPGLFNPTAYLTAVMQVTARRTGAPLDKMTTETHITTMMDPSMCTEPPQDGAFVHGLFIEGARWATGDEAGDIEMVSGTATAGSLVDSRLKELLPMLPVIYVKAVEVQPTWEPSAVGYLRHEEDIYEAPVYITQFRGPTYVFLATLKSIDPTSKWVLTGTAVIMSAP